MQFNHVANRVDVRHFEAVVAMFEDLLNFSELRRTERAIWLRQPGANIDLQFSRVSRGEVSARDPDKARSQVSFLDDDPRTALERLANWAGQHGMAAEIGSYSDKEFYLDIPDAFIDFVVEAMLPELADYDHQVA